MSKNCKMCMYNGIACLDVTVCPHFAITAKEEEISLEEFSSLFGVQTTKSTNKPLTDQGLQIEHQTGWDTLFGSL